MKLFIILNLFLSFFLSFSYMIQLANILVLEGLECSDFKVDAFEIVLFVEKKKERKKEREKERKEDRRGEEKMFLEKDV